MGSRDRALALLAALTGAAGLSTGWHTTAEPTARAATWPECGPIRRGTAPKGDVTRQGEHAATWSSDGSKIAFAFDTSEPETTSVFVSDTETGATRLVIGGGSNGPSNPAWSPDGLRIAFGHGLTAATIGVDGGNRRELKGEGQYPVWSPDGCWIAVSDLDATHVVRPDGTGRRVIGVGEDPAWSPDGNHLAYSDGDIWLAEVGSWKSRRLISPPGVSILPAWSPDSKQIAYAMGPPREDNFFGTWAGGTLYIVDVATGRARRVIDGNQPSWSPDGKQIAFVRTNGCTSTIWIVNTDGTGARRLTRGPVDQSPSWSPDGTTLAFDGAGVVRGCLERPARIWLTNADGTGARRLTPPRPALTTPKLRGLTVTQAITRLRAAGYGPAGPAARGTRRYRIEGPLGERSTRPAWRICIQQAAADPSGTITVDLVAAAACVVRMPNLRGKTLRTADKIMRGLGFWIEPEAPGLNKGDIEWDWRVCDQDPNAGVRLRVTRSRFLDVVVAPRCSSD